MQQFIRIGVDLSKGFFQVHALEREGSPALKRKLSRARFLAFFAGIAPCRIGMEACGSAHHWARELRAIGHEVALIAPAYVKPYLKRGKTDANDAAALLARRCRGPRCGSFRSRARTSRPRSCCTRLANC
jgi:transposase